MVNESQTLLTHNYYYPSSYITETNNSYLQVSHTNPDQPSLSLLRKICYPQEYKFTSTATIYGCTHEKEAIEVYKSKMTGHSGFIIKSCGFIVDEENPFLGASPDGLIECTCCGCGVLEVKCPFVLKKLNR